MYYGEKKIADNQSVFLVSISLINFISHNFISQIKRLWCCVSCVARVATVVRAPFVVIVSYVSDLKLAIKMSSSLDVF